MSANAYTLYVPAFRTVLSASESLPVKCSVRVPSSVSKKYRERLRTASASQFKTLLVIMETDGFNITSVVPEPGDVTESRSHEAKYNALIAAAGVMMNLFISGCFYAKVWTSYGIIIRC